MGPGGTGVAEMRDLPQRRRRALKDRLFETPPRYRGGLIGSLIGVHPARSLYHEARFRLRGLFWSQRRDAVAEDLERNGIHIIEDFLDPETFAALKAEVARFEQDAEVVIPARPLQKTFKITAVTRDGFQIRSESLGRSLFERTGWYGHVEAFLKRPVRMPPHMVFVQQSYAREDLGQPMADNADTAHLDVPYRTVRCVLYLSDTDERNGAFEYAPGSNRLTWRRIAAEYRHSVAYYWRRWRERGDPASNPIRDLDLVGMGATTMRPICGKANTLVLFDARGVHRRGQFQTDERRDTIFIDFRAVETPFHKILSMPKARRRLAAFMR